MNGSHGSEDIRSVWIVMTRYLIVTSYLISFFAYETVRDRMIYVSSKVSFQITSLVEHLTAMQTLMGRLLEKRIPSNEYDCMRHRNE